MSNINQTNRSEHDDILESLINFYVNNPTLHPPSRNTTRSTNYPLSFNIQQPRQNLFTQTHTMPSNDSTQHQLRNQQYSSYLSIVQCIRDIGSQYNNNIREYNSNIRQIFTTLNGIHRDIRTLISTNEIPIHRQPNQSPRPEHSRFYNDAFMQQSGATTRPNQNRSYNNTPFRSQPSNNIFDMLLQTIPLAANLENVVVRPSQEQIRNATRSIIYNSTNTRIMNNTCPITLEPFEEQQMLTQITYCGHVFSQDGINRWFEGNVRCPICRYDIRSYNARCSQCRRPLEEYGTRCRYCEEAGNTIQQEDMDTEENEESQEVPETNNTEDHDGDESSNDEDNLNQLNDLSMNPFQVILNYEIRAPDFVFNSTDISFNLST